MKLYTARSLLVDADTFHPGGGVLVRDDRVVAVASGPAEVRALTDETGAECVDLGDGLIAPALVNAHAHLDLTAFAGVVSGDGGFGTWIARLLELRAGAPRAELERGVADGAARLVATGTARVGDIDSTGLSASVLATSPLAAVVYHEALDAGDPARTERAVQVAEDFLAAPAVAEHVRRGLSPHAPFTVGPLLFRKLGRLAREHGAPVAIHWSETPSELDWLLAGAGPLAGMLGESPRTSGLDLIEGAGLLGPGTALIHGNLPTDDEPERIAAAGATLVHCPGTHRFFERAPFPLERYRRSGVRLALGTDSLASNDDLDLRRELALLREQHPGLDPGCAWTMATLAGAAALGYESGRLAPEHLADFCLYRTEGADLRSHLEALTSGIPAIDGLWVGGSTVPPPGARAAAPGDR